MSLTKLSGDGSASAASNRSTMAPESPVAANRRSLAASSVRRNSGSCGRRKLRGWGSKVSAAAGRAERAGARARRRDHRPVALMHAVEIADGDDRARQPRRERRLAMADGERVRLRRDFGHRLRFGWRAGASVNSR